MTSLHFPSGFTSLLIFIFLISLPLNSEANRNPANEQAMTTYSHNVGDFVNLSVQNNVNVIYTNTKDTIGQVSYSSTPEFKDAFIFENNGKGTLKIQVQTDLVGNPNLPTLYVSSGKLEKVENYSDFNVNIESNIKTEVFTASLVGNGSINFNDIDAANVNVKVTAGMGTIIVAGSCTNANFQLYGAGTIDADRLKARNVNCKILGGGSISCYPSSMLNVKGIGSTKIYYRGNPEIKRRGGGKLIQID